VYFASSVSIRTNRRWTIEDEWHITLSTPTSGISGKVLSWILLFRHISREPSTRNITYNPPPPTPQNPTGSHLYSFCLPGSHLSLPEDSTTPPDFLSFRDLSVGSSHRLNTLPAFWNSPTAWILVFTSEVLSPLSHEWRMHEVMLRQLWSQIANQDICPIYGISYGFTH